MSPDLLARHWDALVLALAVALLVAVVVRLQRSRRRLAAELEELRQTER
ncbi:MAG: hypothetical protein GX464_07910, partial [Holophagae bacterium]|nr:hypothetical protein [Holophagae bacterium]